VPPCPPGERANRGRPEVAISQGAGRFTETVRFADLPEREGQDASVQEAESHAPCEAWLCADSLALWRGRGLGPLDAHPVQDEADTKE
jgi:hypothetical protein